MKSQVFVELTRHFVSVIVAPPLLTDLGVDYLRRTLASLVAMLIVTGIFLSRVFSKKYVDLGALLYPEPYHRALQADALLMIAFPMLVIGLAAVILAPMLFPDETDYRVLTPLPITRAQIFAAKLAALVLVVCIGVIAINAMASIWFPMFTGGWRNRHPFTVRMTAHAVATLAGSAWMFTAAMAAQGLILVALPLRLQQRIGLLIQATLLVALLLSVPFVIGFSSMDVSSVTVLAPPLIWLPPVWFLGIERWMLDGDRAGGYRDVATFVGPAFAVTLLIIAASYLVIYRSAERLAGMSATPAGPSGARRRLLDRLVDRDRFSGPQASVVVFAAQGLMRSRLHQFVFLLILAVSLGLIIGEPVTVRSALAMPLLMALATAIALRTIFLLPLDHDAAWVFRITEDPASRVATLDGVAALFRVGALIPAVVLAGILQQRVLGWTAIPTVILTTLATLILVEFVVSDWRRIPYTCSYLPGKRVLAYTLGVLFASYAVFVFCGAGIIRWAIGGRVRTLIIGGLLLAILLMMRRARLRTRGRLALEFEDYDPMAVKTLGLIPDERP